MINSGLLYFNRIRIKKMLSSKYCMTNTSRSCDSNRKVDNLRALFHLTKLMLFTFLLRKLNRFNKYFFRIVTYQIMFMRSKRFLHTALKFTIF